MCNSNQTPLRLYKVSNLVKDVQISSVVIIFNFCHNAFYDCLVGGSRRNMVFLHCLFHHCSYHVVCAVFHGICSAVVFYDIFHKLLCARYRVLVYCLQGTDQSTIHALPRIHHFPEQFHLCGRATSIFTYLTFTVLSVVLYCAVSSCLALTSSFILGLFVLLASGYFEPVKLLFFLFNFVVNKSPFTNALSRVHY